MMPEKRDIPLLLGCIAASVLSYKVWKFVRSWWNFEENTEFVPIGTVKSLYIYPLKSGKPKKVFSLFCGERGAEVGELKDRAFQLIDGNTGEFFSARQKPQIVLIELDVKDEEVTVTLPDKQTTKFIVDDVKLKRDIRATICKGSRIDTLDCGQNVSLMLSVYLGEENVRLVMIDDDLYNERVVVPSESWWNNPVPKRKDRVNFHEFAPFLIQTEGSLEDLNSRLEEAIEQIQLRPVIVVDKCAPWDEDRWSDVKIGNVEIQCYRPCTRCLLSTVNPHSGTKHPNMEPLRTLREFRLAPEGRMRSEFKNSPMFGICGGATKTGIIQEGQTVYVRYKNTPF